MQLFMNRLSAGRTGHFARRVLLGLILAGSVVGGRFHAEGLRLGTPPTAPPKPANAPRGIALQGAPPAVWFSVDTSKREEARAFYRLVHGASDNATMGWAGDWAGCVAGTTLPAFRDLVALRINYFRAMAGVPAWVSFEDDFNAKAQAAALMMSRNTNLSHYPPTNWLCYTADGAEAAGQSNLALGQAGPETIDGYMQDFGLRNGAVGHRRWLLYPQTQLMGSGDIPQGESNYAANATWVIDQNYSAPRPPTRDGFVAWPSPGYFPYPLLGARWSFALTDAEFSAAQVTLTSNGVSVAIEREPLTAGAGENAVVWYPAGLDPSQAFQAVRPTADVAYQVTVDHVWLGGVEQSYQYQVTVFDPDVPGPDLVLPHVTGPGQPAVGQTNSYTFTSVPIAGGYQWLAGRRSSLTAVEGAEEAVANWDWTVAISPGYSPRAGDVRSAGGHAFHLAQPVPLVDQALTYRRTLLCAANSSIRFQRWLGWSTANQFAKVQISLDDGASWTDVYSLAGTNGIGDSTFQLEQISLSPYAGRLIALRFAYHHAGGDYFPETDFRAGFYFDEVTFLNLQQLENPVVGQANLGEPFAFVPASTDDYGLAVRGEVFHQYHLDWGPVLSVTATGTPPPVITLGTRPNRVGNQLQMDFQVANSATPLTFRLFSAPAATGPWTVESGATPQPLQAGAAYRFTIPLGGKSPRFFRVATP